ncbi:hypothetical protein H6G76_16090 [Nostoc sp. FACHB-152]|nr:MULTISPECIES: hypothetical protein [unclassified Nostoc]MBD2448646.1 hypothetical protein [Nostoc sp. FACHB-152]
MRRDTRTRNASEGAGKPVQRTGSTFRSDAERGLNIVKTAIACCHLV